MISCEKAVKVCHKKQYSEASRNERWQLLFHLAICRSCAAFSRKNRKLSQLCQRAKVRQLSIEEKEVLRRRLSEAGSS
jgi:hypothetical protein